MCQLENKLHGQIQHWGVRWGEVAILARVSGEGLREKITFNLRPEGDEEGNTADISGMVSRHKVLKCIHTWCISGTRKRAAQLKERTEDDSESRWELRSGGWGGQI